MGGVTITLMDMQVRDTWLREVKLKGSNEATLLRVTAHQDVDALPAPTLWNEPIRLVESRRKRSHI